MKNCSSCKEDKDIAEFQTDDRYAGGHKSWCRSCVNKYNRRYRASRTERTSYDSMMSRCYNENDPRYENYGGRGISVCERWKDSFDNFYADMGARPAGTSIDRIDVNGDYFLENCRWATPMVQANNRRNNVAIDYNGKSQTQAEWARELGFSRGTIYNRLKAGWDMDKILSTPVPQDGRTAKGKK